MTARGAAVIETARLILRVPEAADRAALHAMWADPRVMADLGPVKDAAQSDAALARHEGYRREGLGFWVVERRDMGGVIGFCGLKRADDYVPFPGAVEIGWMFAEAHWGRGYAREAAAASLDWAWTRVGAARVIAITAAVNAKSRALMARLGLHYVESGDFDHPLFAPGDRLRASVTYAIDRP